MQVVTPPTVEADPPDAPLVLSDEAAGLLAALLLDTNQETERNADDE